MLQWPSGIGHKFSRCQPYAESYDNLFHKKGPKKRQREGGLDDAGVV